MNHRQLHIALRLCSIAFAAVPLAAAIGCASPRIVADPVYFPSPPAAARVVHLKSFNSLHELVPPPATLANLLHGRPLSPHVRKPAGIAYRNGHLYVCDTDINAVHDWDLASGSAKRLGIRGSVTLVKPVAVAVDEAATVYVADTGRAEVLAFDRDGQQIRKLRPPDREDYRPTALAADGTTLYVADIAAHRVDLFSIDDGGHIGAFGKVGSAPGEFYFPMGLATDGNGRLLLSDMMNARVQIFDADRNPVSSIGRPGNRYGDLAKPRHLAIGPDGIIFIADPEFAHVHLFNDRGQLLMLLGGPQDEAGGTPMPIGVAVATDVPESIAALVPADFRAAYYLFVSNTVGNRRIGLFAVGE